MEMVEWQIFAVQLNDFQFLYLLLDLNFSCSLGPLFILIKYTLEAINLRLKTFLQNNTILGIVF